MNGNFHDTKEPREEEKPQQESDDLQFSIADQIDNEDISSTDRRIQY